MVRGKKQTTSARAIQKTLTKKEYIYGLREADLNTRFKLLHWQGE